jgi:tripartite-type tricarboxylate transporter receptor subunit TctC
MSHPRYLIALALALGCGSALAQTAAYPTKPIRFIMPFSPGGQTDILGRILGQQLAFQLGQSVVAENRPGAGSNLGMELAAKSAPDGYTIVLVSPALVISPSLYKKLNYAPLKDLAPVGLVANAPNILLVHPSVPARTLKELVALARANPGKLNFGSGGVGTSIHLAGEMMKSLTGVNIVHVPYKGGNDAMTALQGGQIEMMVNGIAPVLPQLRSGRVRGLAMLTAERVASLPEVPTAKEAGIPNYEASNWYGVLAPAGTPREIIVRLNTEFRNILGMPEVRERFLAAGVNTRSNTPDEFAAFIKSEAERYAQVIKAANIQAE